MTGLQRANWILNRAAEILIEREDLTVMWALRFAALEDLFLYGPLDGDNLTHLIGRSLLRDSKQEKPT